MNDDATLLRRFAREQDEVAFRQWVEAHLPLVYSVALRALHGDTHSAEDVVQQVFADAARRAATLARHPSPSGWLFTSTRYAASKLLRTRTRRAHRELSAAMDPALEPESVPWEHLRPVIDEVLAELPATDRDAVVERFFEHADYATIGARRQLSANAIRMRIDRALAKLSAQLHRRGIRSTAAALGTALGTHAAVAAPAGLAATVASSVLAGTTSLGVAATATSVIAMFKAPLVATALVTAIGTSLLIYDSSSPEPADASLPPIALSPPSTAPTAPPRPESNSTTHTPTDADYAALADEVTTLQTRLAALDQAATQRLARPPLRGKIYEVRDLDHAPAPRKQVAPNYPHALRQLGTTGRAVVSIVIDQQGQVRDLRTVTTDHEQFAEAALAAVSNWEFDPGTVQGLAVNTRIQVPIVFSLSQKSPPLDAWF